MGNLVNIADSIISDCARHGVVFHPVNGALNPELTKGEPPKELFDKVRQHRAEILERIKQQTDFGENDDRDDEMLTNANRKRLLG